MHSFLIIPKYVEKALDKVNYPSTRRQEVRHVHYERLSGRQITKNLFTDTLKPLSTERGSRQLPHQCLL